MKGPGRGCQRSRPHAPASRPADLAREAPSQFRRTARIRQQCPVADVDIVGRKRLEPWRRRNVRAGGERAAAALLLRRKVPVEIELRGIGMRRILEDGGGDQKALRLVGLRETRLESDGSR